MMTVIMRPKNQTFREGGGWEANPPEFFREFRGDFENCLCNFIEFSILQFFLERGLEVRSPSKKNFANLGVFLRIFVLDI